MRSVSRVVFLFVLSLVGTSAAFHQPLIYFPLTTSRRDEGSALLIRRSFLLASSSNDYLSSLSSSGGRGMTSGTMEPPIIKPVYPTTAEVREDEDDSTSMIAFSHAPISYFAVDNLTPKGPRKNPDVGQPHDATRSLAEVDDGLVSTGSWWCAEGGWPSPALRSTTEVFFVFAGHGAVTDLDGRRHEFGPGSTVVLPKGWSGRWDIMQPIHKVWTVVEHPHIEETSNPIRAVVVPYSTQHSSPTTASQTIYNVGLTKVGFATQSPCSFPVFHRETTEFLHVLEGVFFLTNADGSARRCVAGDTVVLPKGWNGHWDVIETVKKLWVEVR